MEEEVWGGQGPNWAVEPYDDDDTVFDVSVKYELQI
jgi:hypothetical protein